MPTFSLSDFVQSPSSTVPTTADPSSVEGLVRAAATKYNINPNHLAAMAKQESNFNQNAVSPKGALGVMQLMPDTAKSLNVDPTNLNQNIEGGARYFAQLLDRFKGDHEKATAAYNAGPEAVESGKPLPLETQQYLHAVMGPRPVNKSTLTLNPNDIVQAKLVNAPVAGIPSFWDALMGGVKETGINPAALAAGPAGMLFDPQFRQTAKENLPSAAAAVLAGITPGMEEFAPGFAARMPLISRLAGLAPKAAAAFTGGVGGGIAKEGLEGKFPTSHEDVARLANEYGTPQAFVESLFNLPGAIYPAGKFANRVYRGVFRPTQDEIDRGVLETLQKEKIPANMNSAEALAAKHEEVNSKVAKIMAEHKPVPGISPYGQKGVQADTAILNPKLVQTFEDWVKEEGKDKAFKGAWNEQAEGIVDQWKADHPQDWLDFNTANKFKTDMRRQANLNYGQPGNYKDQLYKKFSKIIDDMHEAIEPRLAPLHERLRNIIDAEPAVDRFISRESSKAMISRQAAYPLVAGAAGLGGGMYTFHNPLGIAATAAGAYAAANPANYARLGLMLKNNPELMKQILAAGPRVLAQPSEGQPAPANLNDLKLKVSDLASRYNQQ